MGTGSCSNRVGTFEGKICRQYHFKGSLTLITFDILIQVIFIDFWLQKSQLLKSHQKAEFIIRQAAHPTLGSKKKTKQMSAGEVIKKREGYFRCAWPDVIPETTCDSSSTPPGVIILYTPITEPGIIPKHS